MPNEIQPSSSQVPLPAPNGPSNNGQPQISEAQMLQEIQFLTSELNRAIPYNETLMMGSLRNMQTLQRDYENTNFFGWLFGASDGILKAHEAQKRITDEFIKKIGELKELKKRVDDLLKQGKINEAYRLLNEKKIALALAEKPLMSLEQLMLKLVKCLILHLEILEEQKK